ncbi:MAG: hypothetical protein ACW98K_03445 [Candidatus Kariarchaeaceae archaeon]|jgi:uncharacterized membrane protein (DUF485 family)
MSDQTNIQSYLVGALITSVIGAVLLIFSDFGGWLETGDFDYYLHTDSENANGFQILMLYVLAIGLLGCSYLAFDGMRAGTTVTAQKLTLGFNLAIAVIVATLVETLLFIIWVSGEEDWWLDAGFFGGLIGGILTALLFKLSRDNL